MQCSTEHRVLPHLSMKHNVGSLAKSTSGNHVMIKEG